MTTEKRPFNWILAFYLFITPAMLFYFVPRQLILSNHVALHLWVALVMLVLSLISITGGYHRLISHRAYETKKWVRALFLAFGAAAMQGSALIWSCDHRRHHQFQDTENDPYAIQRGFFFAHMGWLLYKMEPLVEEKIPQDLREDWMIRFQDRQIFWVSLIMCFGIPTFIGALVGEAWTGFVVGGAARAIIGSHFTFLINSAAHYWGSRPYSDELSARDNPWIAVFTFGEGYHNFHHKFPTDFRNGVRWYQWDPTKWLISALGSLRLATDLKRIPNERILLERMKNAEKPLASKGLDLAPVSEWTRRYEEAQVRLQNLMAQYRRLKKQRTAEMEESFFQMKAQLKEKIQQNRREIREAYRNWCQVMKMMKAQAAMS